MGGGIEDWVGKRVGGPERQAANGLGSLYPVRLRGGGQGAVAGAVGVGVRFGWGGLRAAGGRWPRAGGLPGR